MATVEAEGLVGTSDFTRQLNWHDGLAFALSIPVGGFALIGYSIGILGAWTAMTLWGVSCIIAILQNFIFAEMAGMFPGKAGGIALYAHEAWRRYFSPVGALSAVGYWAGWSFALSLYSLIIGDLLQAQFFPHATWSVWDGTVHLGLPYFIAVATIFAVWLLNVFGVRPAAGSNKLLGAICCAFIALLIIGSFASGDWHARNLSWGLGRPGQAWGGWKLAIVYLYVMGWTAYGTECAATFTPEYRQPKRDAPRAMFSAGLLTLIFLMVGAVSTTGVVGQKVVAGNEVGYFIPVFDRIMGGGAAVMTVVLCAAIFLNMTSATADAGRALYGIAKDGMIIKQLHHLNHKGMPARAMTVDLVVNTLLVLFVGNILGILFASNLGYMCAVFFAITGFLLLRRDRPAWPRPIRRGRAWLAIAALLAVIDLGLIVLGAANPQIAGYGGTTEVLIGFGVLAAGLALFVIRRLIQDRGPLRLRERTPATPTELTASQLEPAFAPAPARTD